MPFLAHVIRSVAHAKFWRANAKLKIGKRTQFRSYGLRPRPNSTLQIGDDSIFSGRVIMDREGAQIEIGDRTFVGKSLFVAAHQIRIGSDVLISWGVTIVDHQSHSLHFEERRHDVVNWQTGGKNWENVVVKPVTVADKVWIGFGATLLPGVTIGEGAIVGACSVVTKDVLPWTVVAGNPAREIRRLNAGSAPSDNAEDVNFRKI
jgi:acetyltransferase-like isoleucine patch superfamily enzyme